MAKRGEDAIRETSRFGVSPGRFAVVTDERLLRRRLRRADLIQLACRTFWRSSPRTWRRSIAPCAPRNCRTVWGVRQGSRGARSLRAPRPVAAQISHPRVRPRARRGRTARPRRGSGDLRRGGERRLTRPSSRAWGRGLIRPASLSCAKSSARRRFRDERRASKAHRP
jgi:hypothetical protein